MRPFHRRLLYVVLLGVLVVVGLTFTDFGEDLTLSSIQDMAAGLKVRVDTHYTLAVIVFVLAYIGFNLWFPAAAVLTLLGGYLYGTAQATLYVATAAAIGAMLSFWVSRDFAGNWVQRKWSRRLEAFNRELHKRGYVYLLLVRLTMIMPFGLVNFLAGLTKVRARTFLWTTVLGSLPSILVFSYAGRRLFTIESVDQVLTARTIVPFVLLTGFVIFVVVAKHVVERKTAA